MLVFTQGVDYTQFDHTLFAAAVQAQFPGTQVNSEGDNPNLGTPGFVTVNLPDSDQAAVLAILTTALPAAIAAQQLAQAVNQVNAKIDAAWAAVTCGAFTDSSGNIWAVDPSSRALMTGTEAKIAGGLALPAGFGWAPMGASKIPMTADQFKALTSAIFVWTDNVFNAYEAAIAAVTALAAQPGATPATVLAYVIPAWPTA